MNLTRRQRDLIAESLRRDATVIDGVARQRDMVMDQSERNIKHARAVEMRELAWSVENEHVG